VINYPELCLDRDEIRDEYAMTPFNEGTALTPSACAEKHFLL
jgi:hypothetical protein